MKNAMKYNLVLVRRESRSASCKELQTTA